MINLGRKATQVVTPAPQTVKATRGRGCKAVKKVAGTFRQCLPVRQVARGTSVPDNSRRGATQQSPDYVSADQSLEQAAAALTEAARHHNQQLEVQQQKHATLLAQANVQYQEHCKFRSSNRQ